MQRGEVRGALSAWGTAVVPAEVHEPEEPWKGFFRMTFPVIFTLYRINWLGVATMGRDDCDAHESPSSATGSSCRDTLPQRRRQTTRPWRRRRRCGPLYPFSFTRPSGAACGRPTAMGSRVQKIMLQPIVRCRPVVLSLAAWTLSATVGILAREWPILRELFLVVFFESF